MATKIKDGLFIGDAEASQDPEFIELNKITFVINCAGRQLPNLWEQHGLHYLTFPWTSDPDCTLFDGGNVVIEQITNFIDEAVEKGDSVLVHSLEGTGRCIACVSAYMMFRHRWSFEKALDFLCNKRPDAAPNTGFVQQLYRLDLRLCEQWYGKSKKPSQEERIRHDQWIPLVPGHAPGREDARQKRKKGFTVAAGQQQESPAAPRGKDAIATVIADAAAGCFGAAASTFPSLGRLTEVQEEEIVLVNSFLNSQPQIDALPPGRADYEDHVSKELHWIDRPRIDKLTAAGRLGRTNDRRHHQTIPVSPRTGRATPERPGNSSYNALSRGNKAAPAVPTATVPVGILKKAGESKRNLCSDRGQTKLPSTPAVTSEAHDAGAASRGDTAATVSGVEGACGAPLAPLPTSSSTRAVGRAKVEDEVVVEDLSEPRSDRWSGGDGGTEGCGLSEHETASGGELSSADPEDATDSSAAGGDGENATTISSAGGGPDRPEHNRHRSAKTSAATAQPNHPSSAQPASPAEHPLKPDHQVLLVERGVREARGLAARGRQKERQAWDGVGSSRGVDSAGKDKTGGGYARGRTDGSRDGVESNVPSSAAKGREQAKTAPTRAMSNRPSNNEKWNATRSIKGDVGDMQVGAAAEPSGVAMTAALVNFKQLRRGGSEGSLQKPVAVISGRKAATASPLQDKIRLPQAPVRRAAKHSKMPLPDSPGPGWGPEDIRRDDVGSGRQRREGPESDYPARDESYGKGHGRWEIKAPGATLYPGATDGVGSLQQLAQTPNPQQRRLPSPRPQQDLGQDSSEAGPIFPQQRPNSAPSQRPNAPDSDNSSNGANASEESRAGGGIPATDSFLSSGAGASRPPTSSSVGAANQGYPTYGLMPSGSTVRINATAGDRGGHWGAAVPNGGSSSHPRSSPQSKESSLGASGGGQREAPTALGDGRGGGREAGGGGGSTYSSTENSRQALDSSSEAVDAEQRGANTHRSGYRSGKVGSLPREIRTSQPAAPLPENLDGVRGMGSPAAPPTVDRTAGVGSVNTDHSRPHGSHRGSGGPSSMATTSSAKTTGILRPKPGTLPLPSRRGTTGSDGCGGGGGGEAVRWANPAPRGRQRHANGSSGTYGGSLGNRGGGNMYPRTSKKSADAYAQVPYDGGGQQRFSSRAGGAPIYRSGSPAPVRGRSTVNTAAIAGKAADPPRFLHQHRARGSENTPSRIPPSFRGYMASGGGSGRVVGVGESGERGTTARRSHVPPPKARDHGRRRSGSDAVERYPRPISSATTAPRTTLVAERSPGQRPSTSEGLTNGSGAGRRGRSASPAPRPSSASGRRRSASPSPASLFTSRIDRSFDRPRWK